MSNVQIAINSIARSTATRLVRVYQLPDGEQQRSPQSAAGNGTAARALEGRFYSTSLRLGRTEAANDISLSSALCRVSRQKTIVATAIAGQNGTVKELVQAGDYEIELMLDIIAEADEYPEAEVRALVELANANAELYLDSAFLRIFDIDRAVVQSIELQQATHANVQPIAIQLLSDDPYDVSAKAI